VKPEDHGRGERGREGDLHNETTRKELSSEGSGTIVLSLRENELCVFEGKRRRKLIVDRKEGRRAVREEKSIKWSRKWGIPSIRSFRDHTTRNKIQSRPHQGDGKLQQGLTRLFKKGVLGVTCIQKNT